MSVSVLFSRLPLTLTNHGSFRCVGLFVALFYIKWDPNPLIHGGAPNLASVAQTFIKEQLDVGQSNSV